MWRRHINYMEIFFHKLCVCFWQARVTIIRTHVTYVCSHFYLSTLTYIKRRKKYYYFFNFVKRYVFVTPNNSICQHFLSCHVLECMYVCLTIGTIISKIILFCRVAQIFQHYNRETENIVHSRDFLRYFFWEDISNIGMSNMLEKSMKL